MAKNVNHIQHVRSSTLEENLPKLPNASALLEGELAVNYAADKEVLATKNSSGEVVTFSSDKYYTEKKLGELFSGDTTVSEVILDNEQVVAAALNDLDSRKLDASAYTPTDLSNYYTKSETYSKTEVDNLIPDVDGYFDGAEYNSNDKKIYFKHGNDVISAATIDATDFIKDGMVSSAYTSAVTDSETSAVMNYLYIVFNTDAGKEPIAINLDEIIDPDNFYTKKEIDDSELVISSALNDLEARKLDASALTEAVSDFVTSEDLEDYATNDSLSAYVLTTKFEEKLGSGFTGDNSGNTITKVIIDNELVVSAALNDLNTRKLDASAFTQSMGDYYTTAQTDTLLASKADIATTYTKSEVDNLIPSVDAYFDGAVYDSTTKRINFKHGDTVKSYIDATDFIKDGMVSGVTLSGNNLVITFNTDAGAQDITVDLSTLIPTVDTALDSDSTNPLQNKAVYDAYVSATTYDKTFSYSGSSGSTNAVEAQALAKYLDEKELVIASSLTDLDARLQGVAYSADVETFVDGVADTMQSMLIELSGAVEDLQESQITVDSVFDEEHSSASTNAVEAQALFEYINEIDLGTASALNDLNTRLTATSELAGQVTSKQDTLVSAQNIKTINGESILGSGNISIQGGGGGGGDVNVIEGVKVNGTQLSPDLNKVVDITSIPASIVTQDASHRFVSDTEKSTWNGKQNALSNANVLTAITAEKVSAWDAATASTHTHDNKTVLDGITTAKTAQWDTVTAKTDNTAFTAHTADTTAHVTSAEKNAWDGKVSAITMNGSSVTVTNGTANLGTVLTTKPTYTASEVGALPTGTTLDDIADGTTRKLSNYSLTSHTHSEYATTATVNTLNNTVTAHTADTGVHVTSAEKSTWNGKQDVLSNASVLEGITSQKVSNWDGAATNSHTHANKGVLDSLTQSVIDNSHSHSNSTVLNNLTQTVIDNSHSHTNKTVLDGITTAKTQQWDNAISAVSFNGTDATITNHKAAITATIPTVNDATITLTFNGSTVGTFTLNQSGNQTIDIGTIIGLPSYSAANNGQILGVVNGALAWITPTTIYTGSGTPSSSQGKDGDIYLQTS